MNSPKHLLVLGAAFSLLLGSPAPGAETVPATGAAHPELEL